MLLQDILEEYYWVQEDWLEHTLGSALKALDSIIKVEKEQGYEIEIITNYEQLEQVKYILNQCKISIKNIQYDAEPIIIGESSKESYENFLNNYINPKNYKLKTRIIQERFVEISNKN